MNFGKQLSSELVIPVVAGILKLCCNYDVISGSRYRLRARVVSKLLVCHAIQVIRIMLLLSLSLLSLFVVVVVIDRGKVNAGTREIGAGFPVWEVQNFSLKPSILVIENVIQIVGYFAENTEAVNIILFLISVNKWRNLSCLALTDRNLLD